jgi:hypothetical protein
MKNIINNLIASFKTGDGGWSARKLTAFASIVVAVYVTYTLPLDMRLHALYAWQLLALLCLGIVTIEQIIKFKNGNNSDTTTPQ